MVSFFFDNFQHIQFCFLCFDKLPTTPTISGRLLCFRVFSVPGKCHHICLTYFSPSCNPLMDFTSFFVVYDDLILSSFLDRVIDLDVKLTYNLVPFLFSRTSSNFCPYIFLFFYTIHNVSLSRFCCRVWVYITLELACCLLLC